MATMQLVFLFDLNAFSDDSLGTAEDLQRQLLCLRLACLRILTHYSATTSNFKWGFKFFDSRGSITQTMQNFSFTNVSLENFEILENEICTKYQRHVSYLEAVSAAASDNNATFVNKEENSDLSQDSKLVHPVQLLHLALTQILYEYQWNDCIDMFSPSTRKKSHKSFQKKNMLFLVSKCASNNAQFHSYFGTDCSTMTVSKFTNILLSQSLNKQLLDKASILWIWLNTSTNDNFLGNSEASSLLIIANTLKSLKCALVPLCILSELKYILKLKTFEERRNGEQLSETCQSEMAYSSLVPFSATMFQSFVYPFYLGKQTSSDEAEISFQRKDDEEFLVSVTQVPVQWNWKRTNFTEEITSQNETKMDNNQNIPPVWKKFTVHFAVSNEVHLKTDHLLLLLPSILDKRSSCQKLRNLIKSLLYKNIYLFVVCESTCGLEMAGVLSPLSDSSAVISILNPKACFLSKPLLLDSVTSKASNVLENKNDLTISNGNSLTFEKSELEPLKDVHNHETTLKPFQMESLEPWFEPTSSIDKILGNLCQQPQDRAKINTFHDKLRTFYKHHSKKHKKETVQLVQEDPPDTTASPVKKIKLEEIEETYKDITYEQLISILNESYEAALKCNEDVFHSAKKIIKLASSFFLKKSIISYEECMKSFMAEYFSLTCKKILKKYENNDIDEDTKKINECKLQVILALEMEVLFPSPEGSTCADNVKLITGVLCFHDSGEHKKFLNVLKENYRHKLYGILLEIGGEHVMSDDESAESGSEDRLSGPMSDPFGSVLSSIMSAKSSSSTSSRGDSRKLIKKRSDISDTNKSRQVLLPGKSPKRKKMKYNSFCEKNAIRYSPRIASQKKKRKAKAIDSKPETARRNLFPRDRKPHTPRTSSFRTPKKRKANTPKTHHVLKTNFVPETPSYKQSQSALQRRKSQMDITSPSLEVAESPLVSRRKQSISHFNKLQNREQSSSSLFSKESSANAALLPSTSFQPHQTPESKRRLSLKLFSKVSPSPTARVGLKKCSKRLFDQISPQVFTMPSKKIKLENNVGGSIEKQTPTKRFMSQEKHTPKKLLMSQEKCTPKKVVMSREKHTPKKLLVSQEKCTPKKLLLSQKCTPRKVVMSQEKGTPKKFIMSQEKHTPMKTNILHERRTPRKLVASQQKCSPKKMTMSKEKSTPKKMTMSMEKCTPKKPTTPRNKDPSPC